MKWKCVSDGAGWTLGRVYKIHKGINTFGDNEYLIDDVGSKRRTPHHYNTFADSDIRFINVSFNSYLDEVERHISS